MLTAHLAAPYLSLDLTGEPDCAKDSSTFCSTVWSATHTGWLAASSEWLLVKPFQVLLILVVALLVRWLIIRLIRRVTRPKEDNGRPALLRPLKEKVGSATGSLSERRRQRAATIGSVLRNVTSMVIFSIAFMLILGELGINLLPIVASAGVVGVGIGFGAQSLVKDVISGMFMLLEDQYGVGDQVEIGTTSGTVEAVGLRITTIRDGTGVLWYVRNGEIVKVGNRSQSWAMVQIDVPIGFGASIEAATAALGPAVTGLAEDEEWSGRFIDPPELLGVQQITADGAVLRAQAKTTADDQAAVARELRRRLTAALDEAGLSAQLGAGRLITRGTPGEPPTPPSPQK